MKNFLNQIKHFLIFIVFLLPGITFADGDPFTSAGTGISNILFGTLGMTLCAITIGATFIMAKFGKVSWDRFLTVAFCVAGFIGAPSIVSVIKSWVGGHVF